MTAPAPATPSTPSVLARFFPGLRLGPLAFGAPDVTGLPHNGIDLIGSPTTRVNLPTAATFVWSGGNQAVFKTASGQFLSFLHIVPGDLVSGRTYNAGTQVGTVSALSGTPDQPRYSVDGYTYYSTTPHLHFAVVPSLDAALRDTQGLNPIPYLGRLYSAATGTGGTQPQPQVAPGIVGWFQSIINHFNGADSTLPPGPVTSDGPQAPGPVLPSTQVPGFAKGIQSAGDTVDRLGAAGSLNLTQWSVLIVIALAGLVVLAALVRGSVTVKEVADHAQ